VAYDTGDPLNISAVQPYGAYSAPADGLAPADIAYFGGKAANFGLLRQSIPANSPVATAFSFDLWSSFMDRQVAGDYTLREEIAQRLSGFSYPPDMSALAAVLAGAQSIHTTCYDEAYSLPTEASHKLSIRTQQIIAYESRVANTVDPLGGSYLVESLTNQMEEKILALMQVIEEKGGFIQSFKDGWVEEQINEARYRMAEAIESGDQPVVGLNVFREEEEDLNINLFQQASDMQAGRIAYVQEYRQSRAREPVQKALEALYDVARTTPQANLFEPIMQAVAARATLQEISDALRRSADFTIPG